MSLALLALDLPLDSSSAQVVYLVSFVLLCLLSGEGGWGEMLISWRLYFPSFRKDMKNISVELSIKDYMLNSDLSFCPVSQVQDEMEALKSQMIKMEESQGKLRILYQSILKSLSSSLFDIFS